MADSLSSIPVATSNAPEEFASVQSAAVQEIHGAVAADGQYATAFRPASTVESGLHSASSETFQFSDAQAQAIAFFDGRKAEEQAAINGGRNGVVSSGYVNYAQDTGA